MASPATTVVASIGDPDNDKNPGFVEEDGELEKVCWEAAADDSGDVVVTWDEVGESHFAKWSNGAEPLEGEEEKIQYRADTRERLRPLAANFHHSQE